MIVSIIARIVQMLETRLALIDRLNTRQVIDFSIAY